MDENQNDLFIRDQLTPRPPRRRNDGKKVILIIVYILVVALLAVSAFFISNMIIKSRGEAAETTAPQNGETTEPPETTSADPYAGYLTIPAAQSEVNKGNLILINSDFPYVFPTLGLSLDNVYDNRPEAGANGYRPYKLSTRNHELTPETLDAFNKMMLDLMAQTGNHCVQITSSYRSYEAQDTLFRQFEASLGAIEAAARAALPGNSEHHTGLSMDLNIYGDDGKTYSLDGYDNSFEWMQENMHKYGFILRYPSNKTSITRITYEPWHIRYVGVPHAYVIAKNNWCLEEYTAEIRDKYPLEGNHLVVEDDAGGKYEIYYVRATGELTDLRVPTDKPYTISGNNVDGFVVTVTLG